MDRHHRWRDDDDDDDDAHDHDHDHGHCVWGKKDCDPLS
jgi:hypothetical protein